MQSTIAEPLFGIANDALDFLCAFVFRGHVGRSSNANCRPADSLQHVHDDRLVRASEVSSRRRSLLTIVVSWLIALPEYALQVPANRSGHGQFSAPQLKIIQEAISITVFVVFSILYPRADAELAHRIGHDADAGGCCAGDHRGKPFECR